MAADDSGVHVRIAEFDPATGVLDPDQVIEKIDGSTRLVAVCLASNALGSVVDVAPIAVAAHEVGALVYVDAVHAGPHLAIDVTGLECDFLVASSYKFFGPHTGMVFGRSDLLAGLHAYKVRPAPSDPPAKWETGTQSFESLAGVTAAVDYLASLGDGDDRRSRLRSAYERIAGHESHLGEVFLTGIGEMGHVRLYGVPVMTGPRVATFAVSVDGMHPDRVASAMADAGVYVWSGNYYAVNAMDRLGVLDDGGLVRIGFVHYNTEDEVGRALEVLAGLR
jgi:cysteine desulfurase family protein (TIGR01976 family)